MREMETSPSPSIFFSRGERETENERDPSHWWKLVRVNLNDERRVLGWSIDDCV